VVDGVLVADLPTRPAWAANLPAHVTRTSTLEAYFEGVVDQVAWHDEAIVVGGWMRHRSLDVTETPELVVVLRSDDREVPLALEHRVVPAAALWSPTPHADCTRAGFRVTIPYADLSESAGPWVLEGTITASGISSSGRFLETAAGSPAREPGVRVVDVAGGAVRVDALRDPLLGFALRTGPVDAVTPEADADDLAIRAVALDGDHLVLTITGAPGLTLRGPGVEVEAVPTDPADVVRLPLTAARFGGPPRTLPSGDYRVVLGDRVAVPSPELAGELPRLDLASSLDLSLGVDERGRLVVGIRPPLGVEELGGYQQRRLQDDCRSSSGSLADTVLLASWHGDACADSQRAIADELARVRPDLTTVWGVADGSVEVPAGADSVQVGSKEWYAALATSRIRSSNTGLGPWVPRRPGQVYLQTFAGQPFEAMGLTLWRSRQHPAGRVRHEIADVNREWDLILATSDETAEYYRREFEYAGPILVSGQPRTDRLVTADAATVRAEVLRRLGVPVDRTVVLWSPTVRDPATASLFERHGIDPLDPVELARQLGPDHVVLSRAALPTTRSAQVLDVSAYPQPDDLLIAADLAVLDYSSLRLDWAITGKPVVFFVPDLEPFFDLRPPLFDFAETAPGPLLRSTAAVAEALADPRSWTADHQATTAAVNQRFNRLHDGQAAARVVAALLDEDQAWRATAVRAQA
jgi:CDP-glycerol glycerophosphotransferase